MTVDKQREPDWSPGDVIAADAEGNILLDDGVWTWNPERAHTFLNAPRVRKQLHKLWGLAVGTPGYDKREWELLQQFIEQLLLPKKGGDKT